jgi:translation initiation factor IF-2
VYSGVGPITTSDANLAAATGAWLVSFNLPAPARDADAALRHAGVRVVSHRVIYHLLDEVGSFLEGARGAAAAAASEQLLGSAAVVQVFPLVVNGQEDGRVAGVRLADGKLVRHWAAAAAGDAQGQDAAAAAQSHRVVYRLLREGEVVYEGPCSSLRRRKDDVEAVEGRGAECGVVLDEGRLADVRPGDVLQCVAVPAAAGA